MRRCRRRFTSCCWRTGIYLHENLITAELARDNAYEFICSFPVETKGSNRISGNPIAIR